MYYSRKKWIRNQYINTDVQILDWASSNDFSLSLTLFISLKWNISAAVAPMAAPTDNAKAISSTCKYSSKQNF